MRSQDWEEEAPAETTRSRRARQSAPTEGRSLTDAPPEFEGPEADALSRPRSRTVRPGWRSAGKRRFWFWPESLWGKSLVGFGAVAIVALLVVSIFFLKNFLGSDSRFRIDSASKIEAVGMSELARADLLQVFGADIGRNIFFVPLGERRHQLEQIPWVERATVMRLLPDRIRISVVERKPVAFVRHGGQVGLVDADGVLLTMPAAAIAQHQYSFPVVSGLERAPSQPERKERMAVYRRLLTELDSKGARNSDQISEIDLGNPENVRILMPEQGQDIAADLGEDHFLERFDRYKLYIAQWRRQYPQLSAVDLRYDDRVYLKMSKDTPSVQIDNTALAADGGMAAPAPPAAPVKAAAAAPAPKPSAPTPSVKKPSERQTSVPALAVKASAPKAPAHAGARPAAVHNPAQGRAAQGTLKKSKAAPPAKAGVGRSVASKARPANAKVVKSSVKVNKPAAKQPAKPSQATAAPAPHAPPMRAAAESPAPVTASKTRNSRPSSYEEGH